MTGRAVIGDQLRMPVMWCEMGSCISRHADPAALGEADTRARAIGAGWRIDALGRLACPRCQQTDPGFWATGPVVLWDRYTALARAARITALPGNSTAGNPAPGNGRDLRHPASPAASPPEPGWHRQYPAAQSHPGRRRAERPASTPIPAARPGTRPEPGAVTAAARCTRQAGEHTRLTGRRWQRTDHTWRAAPRAAAG